MRLKVLVLATMTLQAVLAESASPALDQTIDAGLHCLRETDYRHAAGLFRTALEELDRSHSNDARRGSVLNNLGAALYGGGNFAEAEIFYGRALDELRKASDPGAISVTNNLATLYRRTGQFGRAQELYTEALRQHTKTFGPDSPQAAIDMNNLAEVRRLTGHYVEGERDARRSAAILKSAGDTYRIAWTDSLQTLGMIRHMQRDFAEAESLYQESLANREASLKPDDERIAATLAAIANLRTVQGRFDEADKLLRQALLIWRKRLGEGHPSVAAALNNLAQVSKLSGRLQDAEELYRKALEIWGKSLGSDSVECGLCLGNFGDLLQAQGRLFGAESLYRESIAILAARLEPEHPSLTSFQQALDEVVRKNRWKREATVSLRQLMKK